MTYVKLSSRHSDETATFEADNLLVGASFGWDAFSVGLVYGKILSADGALEDLDGDDSYELSAPVRPRRRRDGQRRRPPDLRHRRPRRRRGRRRGLDRRLRYHDGVLIPNNGTVRGEGGLRPAFSLWGATGRASACRGGRRPLKGLLSGHPRRYRGGMSLQDITRPHRRRRSRGRAGRRTRSRSSPSPRCSRAERVRAVLEAGQRVFGENRVQEAEGRWPPFRAEFPDVRLHLVGPLQSNKLARALALFDAIHTLDRDSLARKLASAVQARGACPTLFVQVNTGRRAAEGRGRARRARPAPRRLPRRLRPAGLRAHVHPADRRGPGPALRRCSPASPPSTASPGSRWA